MFHGGMDFEISFKFRTDQLNGLLLFIYNKDGPDFLAVCELIYLNFYRNLIRVKYVIISPVTILQKCTYNARTP